MTDHEGSADPALDQATNGWSAWRVRYRRRLLKQVVAVGAMLMLGATPIVLTVLAGSTIRRAGGSSFALPTVMLVALAVPLLAMGLVVAPLLNGVIRRWPALNRVPAANGVVCIGCRRMLDRLPTDANGRVACPCGVSERPASLRRYWEQCVVSPTWAEMWRWRRLRRTSPWRRRWHRMQRWMRRHPIAWTGIVALIMLVVGVPLTRLLGSSWKGAVLGGLPFIVLFGIVGLVSARFVRPRITRALFDRTRCCAACGYALPPGPAPPACCPECGADWNQVTGTRVGGGKRFRLAAIAFPLAIGLGVGFAPQGLRLVTPILPTGALLALLDAGPFLGDAAARALTARQFSPNEIPKVAGTVLDLRRDGTISNALQVLLDGMALAGQLPADLRRRYVAEAVELTVTSPERGFQGDPILFALAAQDRTPPFGAVPAFIVFGGWQLPGEMVVGRRDMSQYARLFAANGYAGLPLPTLDTTPDRPGPLTVTAEVWIVLGPSTFQPGPVAWNPDGSLVLPTGALALERVEVDRTVTIQAGPPGAP